MLEEEYNLLTPLKEEPVDVYYQHTDYISDAEPEEESNNVQINVKQEIIDHGLDDYRPKKKRGRPRKSSTDEKGPYTIRKKVDPSFEVSAFLQNQLSSGDGKQFHRKRGRPRKVFPPPQSEIPFVRVFANIHEGGETEQSETQLKDILRRKRTKPIRYITNSDDDDSLSPRKEDYFYYTQNYTLPPQPFPPPPQEITTEIDPYSLLPPFAEGNDTSEIDTSSAPMLQTEPQTNEYFDISSENIKQEFLYEPMIKRGRGRPRLHPIKMKSMIKGKIGRPRIQPQKIKIPGRPRGRPRKIPTIFREGEYNQLEPIKTEEGDECLQKPINMEVYNTEEVDNLQTPIKSEIYKTTEFKFVDKPKRIGRPPKKCILNKKLKLIKQEDGSYLKRGRGRPRKSFVKNVFNTAPNSSLLSVDFENGMQNLDNNKLDSEMIKSQSLLLPVSVDNVAVAEHKLTVPVTGSKETFIANKSSLVPANIITKVESSLVPPVSIVKKTVVRKTNTLSKTSTVNKTNIVRKTTIVNKNTVIHKTTIANNTTTVVKNTAVNKSDKEDSSSDSDDDDDSDNTDDSSSTSSDSSTENEISPGREMTPQQKLLLQKTKCKIKPKKESSSSSSTSSSSSSGSSDSSDSSDDSSSSDENSSPKKEDTISKLDFRKNNSDVHTETIVLDDSSNSLLFEDKNHVNELDLSESSTKSDDEAPPPATTAINNLNKIGSNLGYGIVHLK